MINTVFLWLMALMGLIGFACVTFYNNADEEKAQPLGWFKRLRRRRFGVLAGFLSCFFAYFPIAIIFGQITPHAPLVYQQAFVGDVIGMACLTWAVVIRQGNIACLLRIKHAAKELERFKPDREKGRQHEIHPYRRTQ